MTTRAATLLAYPFRPFFLLAGLYGAIAVVAWLFVLRGWVSLPASIPMIYWHAHEMLFGLVPAAIAGFVLTAMTNWTGAPPLANGRLMALLLIWVAGRIAMWLAGTLPLPLVAVVDGAFLPILTIYIACVLARHGNRRNYLLVAAVMLLGIANLGMHTVFLNNAYGWLRPMEIVAFNAITLVMVIIAGRITPAFTANWLKRQGADPSTLQRSSRLDLFALVSTGAMIPADLLPLPVVVPALVALVAAAANGWRLLGWQGWRARSEPLLWILHTGYAWIVAALVLKALSEVTEIPASAWLHAMGAGAMGTLILGVMTRVAVGHTGRPLKLPRGAVAIYITVLVAAAIRVMAALPVTTSYTGYIALATLLWGGAFLLFTVIFWPILSRPRVDGRPG